MQNCAWLCSRERFLYVFLLPSNFSVIKQLFESLGPSHITRDEDMISQDSRHHHFISQQRLKGTIKKNVSDGSKLQWPGQQQRSGAMESPCRTFGAVLRLQCHY